MVTVGEVGCYENYKEGEKVGWGGKGLGMDGGIAHIFYDCRHKDRHARKGHVAAEEHKLVSISRGTD